MFIEIVQRLGSMLKNDEGNFNHLPQPQYDTYLCELCENDSHYGYDCQPQFSLLYEQEPSYNQNYNDNYYPHNSPSFLCCDNCGGSHETFQCQPMDQNINSSGFDQIQPSQYPYPVIDHPSQEMSEEVFQAKGNLMKSIQTFLEKNRIPFGEMPKILLQAWEKFFAIQHAQPEDTNEFNDEKHFVQYKEYLENSSNEIAASNVNQEKEGPPQDSDIHQLVREECGIKVCEKQKKNMEDTLLELLKVCRQKEFYCMHNNVDNLIESALNSKLLSINFRSQHLDRKKQEVKHIVEQPTKRRTLHAITPVLPTEEPEYSLSMGYEHLSIIPETKSDEVIKSSAKNLLPISSEYEVTFDDESECDVPVKDESSSVFTTFLNPLFDCNDDFTSSDDESLSDEDVSMEDFKVYSNPLFDDKEINFDKINPHCFNAESDFVESLSNRDTLFNSSPKFDYLEEFAGELMPTVINSCPRPLENFHAIVETLPASRIPIEDSDSQREEIDIFTGTDDLLPPGIESDDYDLERDCWVKSFINPYNLSTASFWS
nr:hypothetical protein [Tanacetum cinerariifolium]